MTAICRVLDVPRSTIYYEAVRDTEPELRQAIRAVAETYPTYGSRRIMHQLRRTPYNTVVNRKHVQRIMREMGLQVHSKRKSPRTTNSQHPFLRFPNLVRELDVVRPDQVWVADITYVSLLTEWVYLAIIMDVFTRAIRGWHLSRSLAHSLTLTALQMALHHHCPEIHHSDQGIQYAAAEYVNLLLGNRVSISMAAAGNPTQNGYAERLIRTIKEEEVALSDYIDYHDAYAQMGHFIEDVYLTKRIHSALGYLTPAEFEAAWEHSQVEHLSSLIVA
jgi:putative transposase